MNGEVQVIYEPGSHKERILGQSHSPESNSCM